MMVNAVRDNLGIGLGGEDVSGRSSSCAQLLVVLDDAVVDDGKAVQRNVRVRVALAGTPWVAQRVWAMPTLPVVGVCSSASWSIFTLPTVRRR